MDEERRRALEQRRHQMQHRIGRRVERERIGFLLDHLASQGVGCDVVPLVDPLFDWLNTTFPMGRRGVDWESVAGAASPAPADDERAWLLALATGHPGFVTVFRDGGDPAVRLQAAGFVAQLDAMRYGSELWIVPDARDWLLEWTDAGGWHWASAARP